MKQTIAHGHRLQLLTVLVSLSIVSLSAYAAEQDISTGQKESELESLRSQIRNVESNIRAASDETELLLRELQKYESAATTTSKSLHDLQKKIASKKDKLKQLETEQQQQQKSLAEQQQLLSRQIRAAYKTGRNDYIKLLLNQQDPALVGRVLAYHNYFNRARAERIDSVSASLEKIAGASTKYR